MKYINGKKIQPDFLFSIMNLKKVNKLYNLIGFIWFLITPGFNLGLFSHNFKNALLEEFMVEKFRIEIP